MITLLLRPLDVCTSLTLVPLSYGKIIVPYRLLSLVSVFCLAAAFNARVSGFTQPTRNDIHSRHFNINSRIRFRFDEKSPPREISPKLRIILLY